MSGGEWGVKVLHVFFFYCFTGHNFSTPKPIRAVANRYDILAYIRAVPVWDSRRTLSGNCSVPLLHLPVTYWAPV